MTSAQTAVQFAGGYTAWGALTVAAAIFLLKGKDFHVAISMLGLYVCTIVTGERIWALWFTINTSPHVFNPGPYWLNLDSVTHVRSTALLVAWPFVALAGHCFISASGHLVRLWGSLRSRMAVTLCGATLCVGLLSPFRMFCVWHDWITKDLAKMAETCNETRRLTDDTTAQLAREYPDDWFVLLVRANYLSDVGRSNEAREVTEEVLRLLPPEKKAVRQAIMDGTTRSPAAEMIAIRNPIR